DQENPHFKTGIKIELLIVECYS
ncbi:unnamed protein product, partial [Oikopleura dioica]